jgi:putative membrane protein
MQEHADMRRGEDRTGEVAPGPNTLRDHLANERTFLAWMRTAIAIVALGFVTAKFGLLLREIGGTHIHPATSQFGAVVGTVLVLGGALTAVLATFKFLQVRDDIDHDVVHFRVELDLGLAAIVTIASVILGIYVIVTA